MPFMCKSELGDEPEIPLSVEVVEKVCRVLSHAQRSHSPLELCSPQAPHCTCEGLLCGLGEGFAFLSHPLVSFPSLEARYEGWIGCCTEKSQHTFARLCTPPPWPLCLSIFSLLQSNKVPVVQHPHHMHPLTPLITYSNDHFSPASPPTHLSPEIDPKTGECSLQPAVLPWGGVQKSP